MHAHLCASAADDAEIVAILQSAPEEQQLPVLLMAAVHSILLAEPDNELASYYPTVTDLPRAGDPFPAFRSFCHERGDDLRAIITRRQVQTNEVGRSALFLPPLAQVAAEVGLVALVDVGTSAGLNLHLDRFAYRYSPGGTLGESSGVIIETCTNGHVPVPDAMPPIGARIGIDRSPIDVTDPDDARWLTACVWPDQRDRLERLRAAIDIAAAHPSDLRCADAVAGLPAAVVAVAGFGHPVVLNSWVLNYLSDSERAAYLEQLDLLGSERDLTWIYAEAPALCAGIPFGSYDDDPHETCLTRTMWRSGLRSTEHLAVAHPHGYWLRWATPAT